ncbi:MAG: DUF1015 family protein, partial [Thermodesulfobacteriota bacterium]|nr:DUF1015 family protein [Thermodesulfobacteriota bacterium]
DGTRHQMWILQDPAIIKKVAESMSKKSIFIADGHHRYETSRNFRNIMRARYGMRTANRSYEYTMMYLTNMDDEGLTILPSHRILKSAPNFQINPFFERIKRWFDITKSQLPLPNTARERTALKQRLKEGGQHNPTFGFYHKGDDQLYILSLKPGAIEMVGDDLHPMLKRLDVLVLSRLILQKGLGFSKEDLDDDKVFHYESSVGTAMSHVQSGDYQMTFLLNPTKMEHVKEIASKSLIMPRKSTYFYPKILTGLVFNKIDPYETIQIT